jgi:hypothetical protein
MASLSEHQDDIRKKSFKEKKMPTSIRVCLPLLRKLFKPTFNGS